MEKRSRRLPKTTIYLIIALVLSTTFFWEVSGLGEDLPTAQNLDQKVGEYLQAHLNLNQFSGSVLLARDGQILFEESYGMADLELQVKNDPDTRYLLGSVSKQFTAAGILLLQAEGNLEVSEPISTYIPDYPQGDTITIQQLLTHSSGIPNYTQFEDFPTLMRTPTDPRGLVDTISEHKLDFDPGEKVAYSNSNYVLLGYIIEQVTGTSYDKFMESEVFQPLGMTKSGYAHNRPLIKKRAEGYSISGGELVNAPYIHMSIPYAAGALYSTVGDLHRWIQALSGQEFLDQKLKDKMFNPHQGGFVYGWIIDELFDYRRISHAGAINGFKAAVNWFPDEKLEIIILSNYEHAPIGEISRDLAAIALDRNYELPEKKEVIQLAPELMKRYTGTYKAGEEIQFEVTFDQGLYVQVPGQPKLQIYPQSETVFFPREINAEIEFLLNEKGEATALIFSQTGKSFEAEKVEG